MQAKKLTEGAKINEFTIVSNYCDHNTFEYTYNGYKNYLNISVVFQIVKPDQLKPD